MPTPDETADLRRERAEEAVRAVSNGADPTAEALRLSNEFSDEWVERFKSQLRRILRRREDPQRR
jgi:hypothetical protein